MMNYHMFNVHLSHMVVHHMDYRYSVRLDHLQLQSLDRRRLIADLVLTYRIIFWLIDLNMSDYFMLQLSSGYSATTPGNPYKLFVNHCRINVQKHF